MALALLCLIVSTVDSLSIEPNKLQFFHYETFSVSCEHKWTVRRNTSSKTSQPCKGTRGFGDKRQTSCTLTDTYPSDSGQYWCESEDRKERSSILNIVVAAGTVILESPALPVTAGDDVTLQCASKGRYDPKATSDFTASFFKNGVFSGDYPEGKMILPSTSPQGLYKCKHPTEGQSAESLLVVTDEGPPAIDLMPKVAQVNDRDPAAPMSFNILICVILAFILYTVIIIVCVYGYNRYKKARAKAESVIYDRLTIVDR